MRDFWVPTILAALIVIGALLWLLVSVQRQDRVSQEACAQGRVWECPRPTP